MSESTPEPVEVPESAIPDGPDNLDAEMDDIEG